MYILSFSPPMWILIHVLECVSECQTLCVGARTDTHTHAAQDPAFESESESDQSSATVNLRSVR